MTLTRSDTTDWADLRPTRRSVTEFGERVVAEMNELGMLVISHVSVDTMDDAARLEGAIIASHSSAYAVAQHPRNG